MYEVWQMMRVDTIWCCARLEAGAWVGTRVAAIRCSLPASMRGYQPTRLASGHRLHEAGKGPLVVWHNSSRSRTRLTRAAALLRRSG